MGTPVCEELGVGKGNKPLKQFFDPEVSDWDRTWNFTPSDDKIIRSRGVPPVPGRPKVQSVCTPDCELDFDCESAAAAVALFRGDCLDLRD